MMIDDCINVSIKMPLQGPDSDGHVSIDRQILTNILKGKYLSKKEWQLGVIAVFWFHSLTWNWTVAILN